MTEKTLILMRHGHAEMPFDIADHERQLTDRGRAMVAEQAQRLLKYLDPNTVIYVSDAVRTQQTWSVLSDALVGSTVRPQFCRDLYLATSREVLARLAAIEESATSVLMIGHNPGWSEIAAELSGRYLQLDPGEAAVLKLEADSQNWAIAFSSPGAWHLVKHLKGNKS